MKKEILTVSQYASSVGLTPARIYTLIKKGKLATVEVAGKKFLYKGEKIIRTPAGRPVGASKE